MRTREMIRNEKGLVHSVIDSDNLRLATYFPVAFSQRRCFARADLARGSFKEIFKVQRI